MDLVSIKDLSIAFQSGQESNEVVYNLSLNIKAGEIYGLVGESGSGKSVTALSIPRLLASPPVSYPTGSILWKGEDVLNMDDRAIRQIRGDGISVIFQEPMTSLNPLHHIEKQLVEVIQLHTGQSLKEAQALSLNMLIKVGLNQPEAKLAAYPHQLSGGERQRVMIAMALVNKPELLIADEPTTALDVTIQAQILKLIVELQKDMGMSVLFITHDLGIVERFADRVGVMEKGKLVEQGIKKDIFENPQHEYTKKLLQAEHADQPDIVSTDSGTLLNIENLKVWFPIQKGIFRRTIDFVKAVDGVSFELKSGTSLGIVGERKSVV